MSNILLLDQLTFIDAAPEPSELNFQPFFRFKTKGKCGNPDAFCELVHAQSKAHKKIETTSKSVHGDFYVSVRHFENVF
ncbi:MAG: hypothetical protein IAF38_14355 [Bacteroidia bacterium]|nr:hypothetical protein [Bacteroidia bacterium]